jgi:hypothetical protein
VIGTATLGGGAFTATVNFTGAAAFTSATSFQCTVSDTNGTVGAVNVNAQTANSVTFKGTAAHVVSFICVGN